MIDCRESVLIVNKRGLHARASAKFVNHVADLPGSVTVTVIKDGSEASGGSILGLMMLGAAKGDTIEIACSGEGAEGALSTLASLVRDGFGED
ncbi:MULTISPECIES: HPr family phosphocarrier protein [Novosphingobium]|jgi:phosphocarrier protein|uniref:Phosphocarrier protein n=2 Tax=Novosphingobium TaxID=165696 RepID=G6EIB8_9SPHN|nr:MULTISPECIES: HPr family phosphocarrier protein [Novosphingobium]AIT78746.1 serine kinase [Novosphingobium pentaromativorans US6-1]EHJ58860.1 phosphocarrier protein [Novosphingobium pentaromativorans US6-1]CCA93607.1 phosphocarrier protein [Novosphingobium sp. PP1Y]CDO34716.1 Phosphocarrier protein HPr [Novosphingobium sp. KN65.2]SLJ89722.1 phosphocarrier protein [Novosphingobium mathurense]